MKATRTSSPFRSKLFSSCKRVAQFLKVRKLRKPFSIRALHFHKTRYNPKKTSIGIRVLDWFRSTKEMDRVFQLKSFSDANASYIDAPSPSPLTPAYVKLCAANERGVSGHSEDVQDACRSFENYLVEMIVEEGRTRDLMDVEELLHCWKNLKSPVFIDLVCRFYGELCKDLFSSS